MANELMKALKKREQKKGETRKRPKAQANGASSFHGRGWLRKKQTENDPRCGFKAEVGLESGLCEAFK
ncbi:hypothetical protein H6P81_011879 [Aristolochia fimbriata]|uniref:Uncharacterized protein n=1 Tax=Aristolochia fimbriata TaxID=158543 RepID=A0AAV7ED28_ARIFI|nr:hypothetical protein H6P81_011879 [Aristolochia fimbriata]